MLETFNILNYQNFIFDWKFLYFSIVVFLSIYSYIPYFNDIFAGKTKPHLFSWLIWSIILFIGFLSSIVGKGGFGALSLGISTFFSSLVLILSLKYGEKNIQTFDWVCLFLAFISIGLWIFTKTPFYSVILIVFIDILAYYPTISKSWRKPFEETLSTHFLSGIKMCIVVLAMTQINFLNSFYPIALIFINFGFSAFLVWRRKVI